MRITMNTIMRQYSDRLSRVMFETARASTRVVTGRLFEKPSEDPSAAIRASQINRQISKNNDYLTNVRDTLGLFDVAESSLMKISDLAEDAYISILEAVNGQPPMGPHERNIFAAQLRSIQSQMVTDANARYSDNYLFGGSSTKEQPFELVGNVLFFRGIDVSSADPELDRLVDEKLYVDFGFGMKIDTAAADPNTILRGTAFDTALPGIRFLGYGTDAEGMPNNVISLIGEIADVLEDSNYNYDMVSPYMGKLQEQSKSILISITQIGVSSMFMNMTAERLEDTYWVLREKAATTELVDTEFAITMWQMQHTAYMAALKMGPNILTPSFIDFMR